MVVRLQGDLPSAWWQQVELTASLRRLYEGRKSQRNGVPIQVAEADETQTLGLQISARSRLLSGWNTTTGLDGYADVVRSQRTETDENTQLSFQKRGLYPDRSSMHSWAAYHLHTYTGRRLTLTGGLRYNAFRLRVPTEAIGTAVLRPSALVGNLGISWACWRDLRLFANTATAFRAPNVDDLGTLGIVDFRYEVPNYQLRPERSRSLEAGVKIKTPALAATFSAYHLQLSDLIGRLPGPDSLQGYRVYRQENITAAYVRGLESRLEWPFLPHWKLAAHAGYTFGHNTTVDEPLRRIPPLHGRIYLQYTPRRNLLLRAESIFATAQHRLAGGDRADNRIAAGGTSGWQIFNMAVFYQYKIFTLTAEFHNLWNAAYRTHGSGVDGRGRSVALRLGLAF